MKVYLEEKDMPTSCTNCILNPKHKAPADYPEIECLKCNLIKKQETRHEDCPLQSLNDYTKQVRVEVIAGVEKRIINYCRRQSKKQFQKSMEGIKLDLLTSIHQIRGEK